MDEFYRTQNIVAPQSLLLRGKTVTQNEYPLGCDTKYQYYRAICHDLHFGMGSTLPLNSSR